MLTVDRILRSGMADGTEEYVSIEGDLGSSLERGTGGYESDMGD